MKKNIFTTTFSLVLGLAITSSTFAGNGSTRNEVRAKVAAGGWEVVWGVNINEAEYAKFIAATYNGNPMAYFNNYLNRNIEKFQRNAPGVARGAIKRTILRAFKDRGRNFKIGKIGVKAGLATYRRWYTVKVPDGTERYKIYGPRNPFTGKRTWTYGYRPKYKLKKVPLPNHHQPYVAFRLYASGSSHSSGSSGSAGNNFGSTQTIRYSLWNTSRQTVRVLLPGGEYRRISPGARRSFTSRGRHLKIKVLNSGRTYTLRSGRHKLFWMKNKGRIGLDLNYRN
ncbi:MAG: hypothetical protein Tsb009_19720 [Planctomycetaceae bacterium]